MDMEQVGRWISSPGAPELLQIVSRWYSLSLDEPCSGGPVWWYLDNHERPSAAVTSVGRVDASLTRPRRAWWAGESAQSARGVDRGRADVRVRAREKASDGLDVYHRVSGQHAGTGPSRDSVLSMDEEVSRGWSARSGLLALFHERCAHCKSSRIAARQPASHR